MKINKSVESFLNRCRAVDLCGLYDQKIKDAKYDEDLIKYATDINGMPYLLSALKDERKQLSSKDIFAFMKDYVNTDIKIQHRGYDSKLFVKKTISIMSDSSIYGFYESKIKFILKECCVCHVFNVDSQIEFHGKGVVYYHELKDNKWVGKKIIIDEN